MILHDSGLSTAPYGLPIILLGQVVDRFSNRTRLLSNQIRTTVEPVGVFSSVMEADTRETL